MTFDDPDVSRCITSVEEQLDRHFTHFDRCYLLNWLGHAVRLTEGVLLTAVYSDRHCSSRPFTGMFGTVKFTGPA